MKQISKECTKKYTENYWEATDGTIFSTREECEKYENSAVFVLLNRLNNFIIAKDVDDSWIDGGGDNDYNTLCPKTQEDIDTLNQIWKMFGGASRSDDALKFSKDNIGQLILMGIRFDGSQVDWCWFENLSEIITNISYGQFELVRTINTNTDLKA